jgi:DNA-binding MarR family transcriptional regulator
VAKFGRRHLEVALAEHDLVLIHHGILAALDDFGTLSQQQLADALDFDKSHLVARIDYLESRELIRRTQDPGDRRRNRVALTPAGQELVNRLRPVARESQKGFLQTLSEAEQQTLISLLRRVLNANDASRLAPEEEAPPPPGADHTQAPAR